MQPDDIFELQHLSSRDAPIRYNKGNKRLTTGIKLGALHYSKL